MVVAYFLLYQTLYCEGDKVARRGEWGAAKLDIRAEAAKQPDSHTDKILKVKYDKYYYRYKMSSIGKTNKVNFAPQHSQAQDPDSEDGQERTLLIKKEAFAYKIPPQVMYLKQNLRLSYLKVNNISTA